MKLVLRSDVQGLGKRGDIIDVADGYARNHLIPAGRAIPATPKIEVQAKAMRRSRDVKDARDREGAETVARKLVPMVIKIPARAGAEGRLFGSVTTQDVVEAVATAGGRHPRPQASHHTRRHPLDRSPRGGSPPPPRGRVPCHRRGRPRRVRLAAGMEAPRRPVVRCPQGLSPVIAHVWALSPNRADRQS